MPDHEELGREEDQAQLQSDFQLIMGALAAHRNIRHGLRADQRRVRALLDDVIAVTERSLGRYDEIDSIYDNLLTRLAHRQDPVIADILTRLDKLENPPAA